MAESRQQRATRNIMWGLISKIITLILGFASRTIFLHYLGVSYLGISGLYTEILGMLSIVELGFGSALTFSMYKPAAENNYEKLMQILALYKKVYLIIGTIVLLIGLALTPFLQYIVRGADNVSLGELRLFFILYLINTVVGYFVTYKYNYLNAYMKNYVVTKIETAFHIATVLAQIIVVFIFKDYLWYLLTTIGMSIILKIFSSIYLNIKYPILKKKPSSKLDASEKRSIFKNVRGLAVGQFASVIIYSTDSIITSVMTTAGVVLIGYVSNYSLIIKNVTAFALILFNSLSSVFGNIVATSSREKYKEAFYEIEFYNFWIYGFVSIAFFCLIPSFITLWLGSEYLINQWAFFLIVLNVYLQGQTTAFSEARFASGNFHKDKWVSLIQAIINLVVSVVCAYYFGLVGIYIGTIAARLFFFIARPYKIYKTMFGKSAKEYYISTAGYFAIMIIVGFITYISTIYFRLNNNWMNFFVYAFVVALLPNILFFLIFYKKSQFKSLVERVKSIFHKTK